MAESDRVAELKRKMQEAAQRTKAEAAAKPEAPAAAVAPASPAAGVAIFDTPAAPEPEAEAPAAPMAPLPATPTPSGPARAYGGSAPVPNREAAATGNGAAAANGASTAPSALADTEYVPEVLSAEELAKREMNRREFLTYAWGGALLLVSGASGVGLFKFMYPRFRAGEFGGKFFLGPVSTMPATDAPPQANTTGKFWLVNTTDEGIKAIYMVCTHLGCLYKWEPSTVRFECPCHGSKFTREGFYIEGPAPRSLDRFEVSEENGEVVVDTGSKITGNPSSESPARAAA